MNKHRSPEILAPAGNIEAVYAAVRAGADAVYLGLGMGELNARNHAHNFQQDTLQQAVVYCHLYACKVYLTLNTILLDEELSLLAQVLQIACDARIDAVIVQDLAVLKAVKTWCPSLPVHASTQMTIHTIAGVQQLQDWGICRVVLARELKEKELKKIVDYAKKSQMETEVFVHGSLCVSVSGQCYLSAMIGKRSANKGNCAGSCRLPCEVSTGVLKDSKHLKPILSEPYDLSLKDLALVAHIEKLKKMGVTSLKIEGRMKRPEYVAATVEAYVRAKQGNHVDLEQLQAVFSRSGFTDGYFIGRQNQHLFGARTKKDIPSNQQQVYKLLRERYKKDSAIYPLRMTLQVKENSPICLRADSLGYQACVTGDVDQQDTATGLDGHTAQQVLSRLGGTAFYAENIRTEIDAKRRVPKSILSQLRRRAVDQLVAQIIWRKPIMFSNQTPLIQQSQFMVQQGSRPLFQLRFQSMEQFSSKMVRHTQVEHFSLPLEVIYQHQDQLASYQHQILIEPDRLMFSTEAQTIQQLKQLKNKGFHHLLISNIAHIQIGIQLNMKLFGSVFLTISNGVASDYYQQVGLKAMTLSLELKRKQLLGIQPLAKRGFVAYGRLPVMVMRACPLKNHTTCQHCPQHGWMRDRKGKNFEVRCHHRRYSELLHSNPIWLADKLEEFSAMDYAVLYFTSETQKQCEKIFHAYCSPQQEKNAITSFTRGLYYRGITGY